MRLAAACAALALCAAGTAQAYNAVDIVERTLAKLEQDADQRRELVESTAAGMLEEDDVALHDLGRDLAKKKRKKKTNNKNNPYHPDFRVKKEKKCVKPMDDRDTEDRYCETFKPESNCNCKEVCHIWGDPHVAPFFSSCSTVAMSKPGNYTVYQLPDNGDIYRNPILIEARVDKVNGWKFVRELFVNQQSVMAVDPKCEEDINYVWQSQYDLYSKDDEQFVLELSANCNTRHETHLNVTVTIKNGIVNADSGSLIELLEEAKQKYKSTGYIGGGTVPESTKIFDDDTGVCTDPNRYAEPDRNGEPAVEIASYGAVPFWDASDECRRPSGLEDGTECACNQQCAAYGDPHMYDFVRKQKLGNDFMADVKDPENRVLYSLPPYYSAVVGIDECAYIRKFYAVYQKDAMPDSQDLANEDNYHVVLYEADKLCKEPGDVIPATRKRILAPQKVVEPVEGSSTMAVDSIVFDNKVNGFNTGTFIEFDDESVSVVPRADQENVADFITSSGKTAVKHITSGGVQAVLKCHVTEDSKRYYFNVCIERNGVLVAQPPDAARRVLGGNEQIDDPGVGGLLNMERIMQSSGWCATGKKVGANYEHRTASELNVFPYNPEKELADECAAGNGC